MLLYGALDRYYLYARIGYSRVIADFYGRSAVTQALVRCNVPNKDIRSMRSGLAALHKIDAIGKVTMRQFDPMSPRPVRSFSAADIKRLRERLKFSQPVFAHLLHTTASTVRKWEQGDTRPTGPALKLLNVIADKGLEAVL